MSIEIIFTIEDKSGTKGTTSVRIADGVTIAGLNGFGQSWATALNNLILGKILGGVAHIIANITGLTSNTVNPISDVEHVGKFQFITASGLRTDCNIPALDETTVNALSADEIDQSQTNVAAFIAAMTSGITVGGSLITPCDKGGQDIVSVVFAREGARNSGARGR